MQRVGTRCQVMHGNAKMTGGGLRKKDLKYNKQGKIVSKKVSARAKREKRLQKAGWVTTKGQFGAFQMKGGASTSEQPPWTSIKEDIHKVLLSINSEAKEFTEIQKEKLNFNLFFDHEENKFIKDIWILFTERIGKDNELKTAMEFSKILNMTQGDKEISRAEFDEAILLGAELKIKNMKNFIPIYIILDLYKLYCKNTLGFNHAATQWENIIRDA